MEIKSLKNWRKGCIHFTRGKNHCGIANRPRIPLGAGRLWHMTTDGQIAVPIKYPFTYMPPEDIWEEVLDWEKENSTVLDNKIEETDAKTRYRDEEL